MPYMVAAHDAVLALALAVHKVIVEGGRATNSTLVRDMMRSVKFKGASGDISFTEQLDLDSSFYTIVQTVDFGQGKPFSNHQKSLFFTISKCTRERGRNVMINTRRLN